MSETTSAQGTRVWCVPFCPDCGAAGVHVDSCMMFPGEPVVHGNFEHVVRTDDFATMLADLSARNDVMHVGAIALASERLQRPAQDDDVGRGDEVAFGSALRVLATEITRGSIALDQQGTRS